MLRKISRLALAAFFTAAGANHFAKPAVYLSIMPAYLPWHLPLVYLSGAAEMAGGIGVLIPRVRVAAGWGLVALLAAVFPANVEGALHGMTVSAHAVPRWLLWLRLPLQVGLIAWVYFCCIQRDRKRRAF